MKISSVNSAVTSYVQAKSNSVKNTKINNNVEFKTNPLMYDTVSFKGRNELLLTAQDGLEAAKKLKSSTSGYRAPLNTTFNDKFVRSLTQGVIQYSKEQGQKVFMVGGDTREATKKYAPKISEMLINNGFDVMVPKIKGSNIFEKTSPVATPVLAFLTKSEKVPLSILLTASHNPWQDGGYNFLTSEGAVASDKVTDPISEKLVKVTKEGKELDLPEKKGKLTTFDPYTPYSKYLEDKKIVDFNLIKNANIEIFYDSLEGTGGYYFPKLLEDRGIKLAKTLNSKVEGPNPTEKNLKNLSALVSKSTNPLKIGLANDGDSDRFGVIDENGEFISPNDVIFLTAYHLIKNKGMDKGTIIRNQATSERIDKLAKYFNETEGKDIKVEQTPVGFKFLGDKMISLENSDHPVIVAGEESGGLTVRNHIPEKDGFVALSMMLELIASENKPLGQILKEAKELTGSDYASQCLNMKFAKMDQQNLTVNSFKKYTNGEEQSIAGLDIDLEKTLESDKKLREYKPTGDGNKIYLKNGSSVLVRKSGTEPIVRLYIDAIDQQTFNTLKTFLVTKAKDFGGSEK